MKATIVRAVLGLAVLTLVTAASAQTVPERPTRPYQGVFGGNTPDDQNGTQRLDVTFLTEGSYDDSLGAALASAPGQYQGSGYGLGAFGRIEYRRGRNNRYFTASGQSGVRRFRDNNTDDDVAINQHSGEMGVRTTLGRRATFSADQRVSYEPYYSVKGLPIYSAPDSGLPPVVGVDYALEQYKSLRYDTVVGLERAIGRGSAVRFGYTFQYTDFIHETEIQRDFNNQTASVSFSHDLGPRTQWLATYNYQRGDYGFTREAFVDPYENHEGTTGLRYERRLSPSRRMFIEGNGGVSTTYTPVFEADRARFTAAAANAAFGVDLARTWAIRADYRRGARFLDGFSQPFYTNRTALTLTGYLSSAWTLALSGGYDTGEVSFSGERNYDTYLAQAQTQYALTRHIALTGTYFFYKYVYDESVVVPLGLPSRFDRNGVRVSIVFWLPLLR